MHACLPTISQPTLHCPLCLPCLPPLPACLPSCLPACLLSHPSSHQAFGQDLCFDMCKKLLDAGVPGLHLYTLNLEVAATGVLERLGLINVSQPPRALPWRHIPATSKRGQEVRYCTGGGM